MAFDAAGALAHAICIPYLVQAQIQLLIRPTARRSPKVTSVMEQKKSLRRQIPAGNVQSAIAARRMAVTAVLGTHIVLY